MDEPPPTQNPINQTTEQPILVLISHSHRRPLSCPPNLKFDLRKVSNPPKHIRNAYDGRSKRLREHMIHMEDFKSLLETAEKSIEEEMLLLVQNRQGKSSIIILRFLDATFLKGRLTDHQPCPETHGAALQVSEEKEEDVSGIADVDTVQLVVSCFCERGKHRSVAFAEELSRHKWPWDWVVQLHHRDVDEVNVKKQDQRRKGNANRKRQDSDGFGNPDVD
jgi:RNase adaptor protein for sRNA GlmZ degradation